jgi:Xaa-Pro dipeptidase
MVLGRSFAAVVLEVGEEPSLHVVEPVSMVDRSQVACGEIVDHGMNLPAGLGTWLRQRGVEGKVAYVGGDFLPVEIFRELRDAAPGIDWVGEADLLYELKSHSETLGALMAALTRGERECDAAAAAASVIMRAAGGFQRVACHHGRKAEVAMWNNPLYGYSTEAPKPGDLVRGWVYGPLLEGTGAGALRWRR